MTLWTSSLGGGDGGGQEIFLQSVGNSFMDRVCGFLLNFWIINIQFIWGYLLLVVKFGLWEIDLWDSILKELGIISDIRVIFPIEREKPLSHPFFPNNISFNK